MRGEQRIFQDRSDLQVVTKEASLAIKPRRNSSSQDTQTSESSSPYRQSDQSFHLYPVQLDDNSIEQEVRLAPAIKDNPLILPKASLTLQRSLSLCQSQDFIILPAVHRRISSWPVKEHSHILYRDPGTWPEQNFYLSPAFRHLGPYYSLPRVRLKKTEGVREDLELESPPQRRKEGTVPSRLYDPYILLDQPKIFTKEQLMRKRRKKRWRRSSSPNPQISPYISTYPPTFPSCPSCSCCLATMRANNELDPSHSLAFTIVSPMKRKKKRCSSSWCLLLILSSCLLVLVLGLLYICQATHVMKSGMTEY